MWSDARLPPIFFGGLKVIIMWNYCAKEGSLGMRLVIRTLPHFVSPTLAKCEACWWPIFTLNASNGIHIAHVPTSFIEGLR